MRIQPDEGILLRFAAKVPGLGLDVRSVNMDFTYGSSFLRDAPEAYETLILDAMLGDASLFTRADEVEAAWGIVSPLDETCGALGRGGGEPHQGRAEARPRGQGLTQTYDAGTWGPAARGPAHRARRPAMASAVSQATAPIEGISGPGGETRWQVRDEPPSPRRSSSCPASGVAWRRGPAPHADAEPTRSRHRGDPRVAPHMNDWTNVRIRTRTSVLTLIVVASAEEVRARAIGAVAALAAAAPVARGRS